jgi:hypothetical protein
MSSSRPKTSLPVTGNLATEIFFGASLARGLRVAATGFCNDEARLCEGFNERKASGGRWDRPELHRLLDQLRKGDVLIVARLDFHVRSGTYWRSWKRFRKLRPNLGA